jgi:hypothetical protein
MGGGGKGDSGEKAYKGNYGGVSAGQLASMAPNTINYDTAGSLNSMRTGTLANGQKIPQYQAGSAYNFKTPGSQYNFTTPNVSNVPQQAYGNVLNRGLEGIQQDQQMFGGQSRDTMAARGLGRSGFQTGAQTSLGREAMQQASGLRSNLGLQQAQSELQNAQFGAGQDLTRQGMQAGENLSRSGQDLTRQGMQAGENNTRAAQSLQAQLGLSGLQQNQLGTYGSLINAQNQQQLQPYQMLAGLYGPALGQSVQTGGKGDPFSALLQAGATGAGMAFGGPAGAQLGSSVSHMMTG